MQSAVARDEQLQSYPPIVVKRHPLEPSAEEQYTVYLLNRIRADPPAYGRSIALNLDHVKAQPPLAISKELTAAARFRSQDLQQRQYFSHTDPDGVGPNRHALESGYALGKVYSRELGSNGIESISGGVGAPSEILKHLIVDKGVPSLGHRKHLLGMEKFFADAREIGVGLVVVPDWDHNRPATIDRLPAYATLLLAHADRKEALLTGVVYRDRNANGQYDLGEGLSGIEILAGDRKTTTLTHGGFQLSSPVGNLTVQCKGERFSGTATASIRVDKENIHLEFISEMLDGVVNFGLKSR